MTWSPFIRRRTARALAIHTPNGIDEHGYVRVGGVDQWVQIRGHDRANPVLLMLPGHGLSMVPFTPLLSLWEKHFTVVQWDRRMFGRTLIRNGRAGGDGWTFDMFATDGIELAEYLHDRLGRGKVIVVAHSQGTVIGVRMVMRRPDLFHAYVGLGQMVDMARNEVLSYEALVRHADPKRARALAKAGPPPYPDPRAWIRKQRAAMAADPEMGAWQKLLVGRTFATPGYTPRDIWHAATDALLLPQRLYDETMAVTPAWLGTRFAVPVLLLHGDRDAYAMPELAREYLDTIEAPAKELVLLDGLGHLGPLIHPDRVGTELIARVALLCPDGTLS
jgi:pimeloyl-ACP methyl ester carboxylesterase